MTSYLTWHLHLHLLPTCWEFCSREARRVSLCFIGHREWHVKLASWLFAEEEKGVIARMHGAWVEDRCLRE